MTAAERQCLEQMAASGGENPVAISSALAYIRSLESRLATVPTPTPKHSPGPWRVTYKESGAVATIEAPESDAPGAVGSIVRQNGLGMPACEIGKANARLIAAAPELLWAAMEAKCWLTQGDGLTPEKRGAKCETLTDLLELLEITIEKAI